MFLAIPMFFKSTNNSAVNEIHHQIAPNFTKWNVEMQTYLGWHIVNKQLVWHILASFIIVGNSLQRILMKFPFNSIE